VPPGAAVLATMVILCCVILCDNVMDLLDCVDWTVVVTFD
jgi:hypothetical protein